MKKNSRKKYQKPELKVIDLSFNREMMAICNTPTTTFPQQVPLSCVQTGCSSRAERRATMKQVLLEIAGVPVHIRGERAAPPPFPQFRSAGNAPRPIRARWDIHSAPVPAAITPAAVFMKKFSRWDNLAFQDGRLLRLRRSPAEASIWKAALMRDGYHRGDIWVNEEATASSDPLFFLDLLLWPHLLIGYQALIIHAAAVKYRGEAFLFPGCAGRGKSTWSGLCSGVEGIEVLGEDKVVLRKKEAGFEVFGTPWNPRRRYASPQSGRLGGIFFLEHSAANRFLTYPPPSAFLSLLQSAFLPFVSKDEYGRAAAILERAVNEVPVRRFGFRPDRSAVDCWLSAAAIK